MNQKEITLLFSYILNNSTMIETELEHKISNIRFRQPTITDCVELIYALAYDCAFKEITTDIRCLLSLYPDETDNKKGGE